MNAQTKEDLSKLYLIGTGMFAEMYLNRKGSVPEFILEEAPI